VQAAVQVGKDFRCTYRILCKNGSTKWVREIGEAVKGDGDEKNVLQGYIVDVTKEVTNEQALVESEQSLEQLADAMPLIVWMAGADGSVYYTSAAFFNYTGLSEDSELILSSIGKIKRHFS
jgi:PAS domain-containing protein